MPVFKSEFERKSDDLRSQIEALRQNLDDVLSSYNRLLGVGTDVVAQMQGPMTSAARTVRSSVEDAADALPSPGGFSWWIPVAIVGAIGAAIWAFNTFFPREAQDFSNQFSQTAQQMGNQVSQSAQQMGNQVSQTADQLQNQVAQSNPMQNQFGGQGAGRPSNFGPNETTFGEQR
jgi:cytoskeletal protein RodZ